MKNIILVLFLMSFLSVKAQTYLKFNKLFIECEDKWVAFQMNDDSTYSYGFIYIDSQAGLTFNYEGEFKVLSNGQFSPGKRDSTSVKVRLNPNNVKVAIIPKSKFDELQIEEIPDWLHYYKTDIDSIDRLYRWGYMYNGWHQCDTALTFLEKAYKIDPEYKGLGVELAFSYNCLKRYDEAITVLKSAVESTPKDAYTNKELIYCLAKSGQLENAKESCRKAAKVCPDKTYNGENYYNILVEYYLNKDKANFNLWLKEAKKWTKGNKQLEQNIKLMSKELKNTNG